MDDWNVKIIDVKKSVLADNDQDADVLRQENKAKKTFYINLMSSPGSGKTTLLTQVIKHLKNTYKIGVMEADIDSDVDAKTILALGVPCIQIHTGGMCHLDADMSRQGLREIDADDLDVVILENVGNLVCPAEFDTGAIMDAVILSVPEGDDKPLKYPLMFQKADVVIVTKIDALAAFDFDFDKLKANIVKRNETIPVYPVSSVTGEGIDAFCTYLKAQIDAFMED